jgi:hypothetical protein
VERIERDRARRAPGAKRGPVIVVGQAGRLDAATPVGGEARRLDAPALDDYGRPEQRLGVAPPGITP